MARMCIGDSLTATYRAIPFRGNPSHRRFRSSISCSVFYQIPFTGVRCSVHRYPRRGGLFLL